ncbi:MAG: hypothetical protein ABSD42_01665 [Candidatus Bathyarchaeia archaeon]|jgi:hypothetical protein
MYTEGKAPVVGVYVAAYSFYSPITATDNDNTLTYSCSPHGYFDPGIGSFSSDGFTITSGFNQAFVMQIVLNITGVFNLGANLVPAT